MINYLTRLVHHLDFHPWEIFITARSSAESELLVVGKEHASKSWHELVGPDDPAEASEKAPTRLVHRAKAPMICSHEISNLMLLVCEHCMVKILFTMPLKYQSTWRKPRTIFIWSSVIWIARNEVSDTRTFPVLSKCWVSLSPSVVVSRMRNRTASSKSISSSIKSDHWSSASSIQVNLLSVVWSFRCSSSLWSLIWIWRYWCTFFSF